MKATVCFVICQDDGTKKKSLHASTSQFVSRFVKAVRRNYLALLSTSSRSVRPIPPAELAMELPANKQRCFLALIKNERAACESRVDFAARVNRFELLDKTSGKTKTAARDPGEQVSSPKQKKKKTKFPTANDTFDESASPTRKFLLLTRKCTTGRLRR